MIQISDYSFSYGEKKVLKNISLSIDNQLVVITGKSGSGKSTLALSIAGFLKDQGTHTGEILIDGKDIYHYDLFELSQKVGIVQQDPESQICTMTVEDEVAFGLENLCASRREIHDRMEWALSIVGGTYLKDRDTSSLSGGEKQKIAIASILAMKPEVLIFDEPTSNLDVHTTEEIMQVITHIKKKTDISAIVIEHKWKHIYSYADSLYEMREGELFHITEPPPLHYNGYEKRWNGDTILEIRGLHCSYDSSPVLTGLDLMVKEGEIVGIMGANGSGKTTLLMCIMNFLDHRGEITLKDQSLEGKKTAQIAQSIGIIFQNPNHQIFENTVYKEAAFGSKNFGRESDIGGLLKEAGLFQYSQTNPFRLSYGEKRRLNIISVLSYRPDVILLDEPFIGQDYENVQKIMDLLQGTTCIIILHDPFIAWTFCDRVLELKGGLLHEIESTD
ncbi:MAG: ABC transporter ATP-binding protein [Theionarchaea archaeon]|nr:ABC transporter ATP-binding protein [Theionarchaea archaeon]